jgi:hypothetical protein
MELRGTGRAGWLSVGCVLWCAVARADLPPPLLLPLLPLSLPLPAAVSVRGVP